MSTGRIASILIMLLAFGSGVSVFVFSSAIGDGGLSMLFYGIPCSFVLFVIGVCVFAISQRDVQTRYDVLCPHCDYNMRGLTEAKCPECGAEFTLDQLKLK